MSLEEREMRAGDYVLGLMDDAERLRAERDMIIDPEFRDIVWSFANRMESLDRSAPAQVPGDGLWQRVSHEIAGMEQTTRTQAMQDELVAAGIPMRPTDRHGHLGLRRPMSRLFSGARGTALAASVLAACGLGYVVGQASVTARDPEVVVVLLNEDDVPGALVEAYSNDRVRIIPLTDFEVPDGKVLEVWTLYDEAIGPVSLGTMASAREAMLTGPALPEPQPQQLYEITLEDAPRSSAGRPLGPILVKGLAVSPPR
jgi:anti-sigma-K factor RskA